MYNNNSKKVWHEQYGAITRLLVPLSLFTWTHSGKCSFQPRGTRPVAMKRVARSGNDDRREAWLRLAPPLDDKSDAKNKKETCILG